MRASPWGNSPHTASRAASCPRLAMRSRAAGPLCFSFAWLFFVWALLALVHVALRASALAAARFVPLCSSSLCSPPPHTHVLVACVGITRIRSGRCASDTTPPLWVAPVGGMSVLRCDVASPFVLCAALLALLSARRLAHPLWLPSSVARAGGRPLLLGLHASVGES